MRVAAEKPHITGLFFIIKAFGAVERLLSSCKHQL